MRHALPRAAAVAVLVLTVAACSGRAKPAAPAETGPLHLTSTAFVDNGLIPTNYSCAGSDLSPPLTWHGAAPTGTSQWALVVEDVSVTPHPYVHWMVTGIDVGTRTVAAGQVPDRAAVQANSSSTHGYLGLCPPAGAVHRYTFSLYALPHSATVSGDADTLAHRLATDALSTTVLTGMFAR